MYQTRGRNLLLLRRDHRQERLEKSGFFFSILKLLVVNAPMCTRPPLPQKLPKMDTVGRFPSGFFWKVETCGRLSFPRKVNLILNITNRLCPIPSALDFSGALQGWEQTDSVLAKKPHPRQSHPGTATASAGKMCLKETNKLRSTNADES